MKFKKAVLILITFVVLAGIHLFIYTQNINIKYRVTDLKVRLNTLRTRNRLAGLEVARKENLSHIERTATRKLGMIYPEQINYVVASREARP